VHAIFPNPILAYGIAEQPSGRRAVLAGGGSWTDDLDLLQTRARTRISLDQGYRRDAPRGLRDREHHGRRQSP
jgi:hypothetical protein